MLYECIIGVAEISPVFKRLSFAACHQVTAHVEDLFTLTTRLPEVNVIIVPPLFRSDPPWFGSYLPDLLSFLTSEVARCGSGRLALCSPFTVMPSLLESDGVHLTVVGGDRFLAHIDSQLNSMLIEISSTPASHPDRLDQILEAVTRNSAQLASFTSIGEAVGDLSRSTTDFETFVRRRFKDDDLIFARMKEESDSDINRSREDRVVITGLTGPTLQTSTHAQKKKHYSDVITTLVATACAGVDPLPKVVDVYINLRKDHGLPLVEARFDSVSGAQLFRREGVRLAKAEQEAFSSLFFSNSVTQSTRVRIEILRELSKKLNTSTEVAFVQGFISRPVLQFRVKEGARSRVDGVGRSYTFVDAMSKFGDRLAQKDLTTAYARAGNTFDGALSQYFIVLVDNPDRRGVNVNRTPIGRRGGPARGGRSRGGRGRAFGTPRPSFAFHERGIKRAAEVVEVEGDASTEGVPSKKQDQEKEDESDLME